MAENPTPPVTPPTNGGKATSSILAVPNVVTHAQTIGTSVEGGHWVDAGIATGNIGMDGAKFVSTVSTLAGHNTEALDAGLKRWAWPVAVINGVRDVAHEDGATHKVERATAVVATTATSVATGAVLTEGLVVGGVAATGTLALAGAAAPVLVTAGAVYTTAKAAELAIQTRRIYEDIDNAFKAKPDYRHASQSVSILRKELAAKGVDVSPHGRIDLSDGHNRDMLREVLAEKKTQLQQTVAATDSILPRWVRSSDAAGLNATARSDIAFYDAASTELGNLETVIKSRTEPLAPLMVAALSPDIANPGISLQNRPPGMVERPSTPAALRGSTTVTL